MEKGIGAPRREAFCRREGWQGQVYKKQYAKSAFAGECLGEYCQYLHNGEALFRTVGNDSTFYRPPTTQQLTRYLNQIPEDSFARHIPQARQMLRKLLDRYIVCEPIMEEGRAGYRFTATGTFDRLLTGMKVINDGGGGHVQPDLFCPTIRV